MQGPWAVLEDALLTAIRRMDRRWKRNQVRWDGLHPAQAIFRRLGFPLQSARVKRVCKGVSADPPAHLSLPDPLIGHLKPSIQCPLFRSHPRSGS